MLLLTRSSVHLFFLLLLLTVHLNDASAARDQFQQWYPEYGFIFQNIIHNNCTSAYDFYLTAQKNRTYWYSHSRWIGAGSSQELVVPLVNCIMEHSPEFVKSNMASAGVLLGLTPAILATLGSDIDETSVLAVVGARPFLALCLAAGSPAVVAIRTFGYRKPLELLDDREGRLAPSIYPSHSFYVEATIQVAVYLSVFAAIANVATLGYQLGRSVCLTFAPNLGYVVMLWCFFGPIPHICAAATLRIRVRVRTPGPVQKRRRSQSLLTVQFQQILAFVVSSWRPRRLHKVEMIKETRTSLLLAWFLSLLTAAHVILGVLLFSSMLFISVRDSITVIARFMASVIVSRIILMYELAKLRELYNSEDDQYRHFDNQPSLAE